MKGKVILINAHLRPDTALYKEWEKLQVAPNDLFDITVSQLSIDEVDPKAFMSNKEIQLRRLLMHRLL